MAAASRVNTISDNSNSRYKCYADEIKQTSTDAHAMDPLQRALECVEESTIIVATANNADTDDGGVDTNRPPLPACRTSVDSG